MQYRFVKVNNLILPVGPVLAEPPRHRRNRASRLLLAAAIGLVITPLILLGVLFVWARPAPIPAPPGPAASAATLQRLQIMQLEHQITQLEQQTDVWAEFRSYAPLVSAIVVLGVGMFGAFKYFRDQDRDYALRVDQELSLNLNQLLDFTKESGSQNARIASTLDNLLRLITQTREPVRHIGRITTAIVTAIKEDINLGNSREARFPALCLEHWPYYTDALKKNRELQQLLPYRYNESLTTLAKTAPDYFSQVQYDSDKSFTAPENVNDKIKEPEYQFFVALVDGLWQHLRLIESQQVQEEARAGFQQALANPHLYDQLQNSNRISIEASSS